jgi:protein-S-isoprenylcysteine O-methyltransferase Ste14
MEQRSRSDSQIRGPGTDEHRSGIRGLVGSGDRIALLTLPVLVVAVLLAVWVPSAVDAGGPSGIVRAMSLVVLAVGIVVWLWSVALILIRVPRGELITTGPFAVMKHPLYTAVSLLVIPALGLLLDTWLGIVVGVAMYLAVRRYAPAEEAQLAEAFGPAWDDYRGRVWLPWL